MRDDIREKTTKQMVLSVEECSKLCSLKKDKLTVTCELTASRSP